MVKRKTKKIKILKSEKILYFLIILIGIMSPVIIVFSKATLSKTSIENSRLELKIKKQATINETLNMKINELASLEKIQALAKELGLTYNNNNIKVITDRWFRCKEKVLPLK